MPEVDLNRQKGNFAEHLVGAWFSRKCLVRPVAAGTDIGVDLYCEAVVENSPFQHFWIQVKAIGDGNIREDGSAFFDFDTEHLHYWQRQPVPVYAMLVPISNWPPDPITYVYEIRLSNKIVTEGIPDQKTIRYISSEGFGLDSLDKDLNKFTEEIVPFDAATQLVPKGMIAPIEQPSASIMDSFPKDVILPHIEKFVRTVMFAAEIAMVEILESKTKEPRHHEIRRLLDGVLRLFGDKLNVLGLTAVANSAFLDGDFEAARKYLEMAKKKN